MSRNFLNESCSKLPLKPTNCYIQKAQISSLKDTTKISFRIRLLNIEYVKKFRLENTINRNCKPCSFEANFQDGNHSWPNTTVSCWSTDRGVFNLPKTI